MSGTLLFDEKDYQATHSKRKKKSFTENKEKLNYIREDLKKNSKTRKDGVSVDFQQKDLETLFMLININ